MCATNSIEYQLWTNKTTSTYNTKISPGAASAVADPGGGGGSQGASEPPFARYIEYVLFQFNTMLFIFKIWLGMLLKLAKAS